MADLGDIGLAIPFSGSVNPFGGYFTRTKKPTSVVVDIDDAPDGAVIALTTRGGRVDFYRATASGAQFYDLDDGDYLAYVMFDGSPGLAWSINVTGTSVTITRISTSGLVASWSFT